MSFMSRVKRSAQNTNFHISSFGKPNILIVKSIIYFQVYGLTWPLPLSWYLYVVSCSKPTGPLA